MRGYIPQNSRIIASFIGRLSLQTVQHIQMLFMGSSVFKSIFNTRCITLKRVRSWRGPTPRHCTRVAQLLSKKCCSGGEPLATLSLI